MKKISIVLVILILFLLYFVITNGKEHEEIKQISTKQLAELLEENTDSYYFIDVREVEEYKEGHIAGMENFPLSQLAATYSIIPKEKTVVIICRSGNRSMQAAEMLQQLGYEKIINVAGGILAWEGEIVQ